jgi:hypothetical protein
VQRRGRGVGRATLVALLVWTSACSGDGEDVPTVVSLAELVADQAAYDGELVTTEGTVRSFDDPLHHWVEDADVNRVELVPDEVAAPHLGAEVRVTGRYTFRDDEGRRIEVERLEVLDDEPDVISWWRARPVVDAAGSTNGASAQR